MRVSHCQKCGASLSRIALNGGGFYYADFRTKRQIAAGIEPVAHECHGASIPQSGTVASLNGEVYEPDFMAQDMGPIETEPEPEPVSVAHVAEPAAASVDVDQWVKFVHAVRAAINAHGLRYVASPRAILSGISLMAAGIKRERVAEIVLWKGMSRDDRVKVVGSLGYQFGDLARIEPAQPASATARYAELKAAITAGVNIMLVGPAGAGKTYVAREIALDLKRDFVSMSCGATTGEDKLMGFTSVADGKVVRGFLRDPYEHGGIALLDEIDACNPDGLLGMNQVAANGHAGFDDGEVARHPDFVLIASANTFGRGADRVYIGRSELDAATLDRFAVIEWDYDEASELEWARELASSLSL